jgi:hypothetical protein
LSEKGAEALGTSVNDFKGLAEIADRLIYEVIALLLPGMMFALFVAGTMATLFLGPDTLHTALIFGDNHGIISCAVCYALGYVVQGLSRPVVRPLERLLRRVRAKRKKPSSGDSGPNVSSVPETLETLAEAKLQKFLGLEGGRLRKTQLAVLAYGTISQATPRLERFRAAASCVRGLATVVVCWWLWTFITAILAVVARDAYAFLARFTTLTGLSLAFWAFTEREKMYQRTWRLAVISEFMVSGLKQPLLTPSGSEAE